MYLASLQRSTTAQHCGGNPAPECESAVANRALWMHSFWYRRYREGNRPVVRAILGDVQNHYGGPGGGNPKRSKSDLGAKAWEPILGTGLGRSPR